VVTFEWKGQTLQQVQRDSNYQMGLMGLDLYESIHDRVHGQVMSRQQRGREH
jgi:hypothetical protein